jgi:hypothetical protein
VNIAEPGTADAEKEGAASHPREETMTGSNTGGLRRALVKWWGLRSPLITGQVRDRGMSTAEYAVGTIAACAFAALLFKVVTSPEVQEMIRALIDRALNTTGQGTPA